MKNQPTLEGDDLLSSDDSPTEIPADGVLAEEIVVDEDGDWLQLTRSAYSDSTDYMSSNLRRQWERNIANFMSRHPNGSKYRTAQYLTRSRLFRPKTRSAVRQNEAAAVAAFFSTADVVSITPEQYNDPAGQISADLGYELMNYRLTKTLPWFKLLIGAFQDAQVYGSCPTCIEWSYREEETGEEEFKGYDPDTGEENWGPITEVVLDQPEIRNIPNENLRISPGSDYLDPINSSPYVQELVPMFIKDVKARTEDLDPKTGKPQWKPFTEAQLLSSVSENSNDSTRLQRENNRQDPKDQDSAITDFTIVWVYRNIMDINGVDMVWWTLGWHAMLTDPVPLDEVSLSGGVRPYVIGNCIIEAHRNYPSGLVELGQEMQSASNDNLNQRFDNVKLALNSRHYVRRTAQVDLRSLKRSAPGGVVLVSDIAKDVKPIETKDVTGNSYQEQERFNNDFDEIMGSFSQSSIQSNRKLGETVGGMSMIKDNANIMTEYLIRTFAETWVEPVLRMLLNLETEYETDQKILDLCADRARLPEGTKVTSELLRGDTELTVNVGFGATDPQMQILKFNMAIDSVAKFGPKVMEKIKLEEVVAEVFGKAGYKNGKRFFEGMEDGEDQKPEGPPPEVQIEMAKLEQTKQIETAKAMNEFNKLLIHREIEFAKIAADEDKTMQQLQKELGMEGNRLEFDYEKQQLNVLEAMSRREDQRLKEEELNFKKTTGKDGI